MSQRVQKGSTVFRPVARPRPRQGTESRQSSSIPEPTSTATGPNHSQDGPNLRAASAMPPPSTIPQKPPSELLLSQDAMPSVPEERALAAPATSVQHASSGPSVAPSPPTIRPTPSRLPPMIGSAGSSQQSSSAPTSTAAQPPLNMLLSHPPMPTIHMNPPMAHESVGFAPGSHLYIPEMHGHYVDFSYAMGQPQIDPQLMGPPPSYGNPYDSQGVSLPQSGAFENLAPPVTNDAPEDSSRPRRSRRRHDAESIEVDEAGGSEPSNTRTRRKPRRLDESDENAEPSTKRRRSSGPRRARTRPPSPPPFDPDADPGEELDPTAVTMATLCDDTGRGRVSSRAAQIVSNHAAWRAANQKKRAQMREVMEAKKYGRNLEDQEERPPHTMDNAANAEPPGPGSQEGAAGDENEPSNDETVETRADGFDYGENLATSRYNVQVRIGANGETIIDEDSLFVNRDEEHQTEDYTHVEESDFTKFVNSATYSKKVRGSRWSEEETDLFYNALSQFGENYELISYVLPGRDRKACKNKFKAEDKKNPARITLHLNNRRPYDIETLSRMTGKDFSGPTPEIRAPTPVRSTELQDPAEPTEPVKPPSPRVVRKKSRTPSARNADVEILGSIDDVEMEKDDN